MMRSLLAFAATALLAGAVPASSLLAAHADLRSVTGMKTHNRVLLVFAPSLRDPRLEQERGVIARFSLGAAERDLLLVQIADGKVLGAHDREDQLRRKYQTPAQRFRVLLLGKDGEIALDSATPVDAHRLETAIDAMPMRQDEIHKARAGHPVAKSI